jgi:hypothetical protein
MKTTDPLHVQADFSVAESMIIINPNDGFELGLLSLDLPVSIFYDATIEEFTTGDGISGKIVQQNKCKSGTIMISMKTWKRINKPVSVRLSLKEDRALISTILQ